MLHHIRCRFGLELANLALYFRHIIHVSLKDVIHHLIPHFTDLVTFEAVEHFAILLQHVLCMSGEGDKIRRVVDRFRDIGCDVALL